jgi:hypothetical protein
LIGASWNHLEFGELIYMLMKYLLHNFSTLAFDHLFFLSLTTSGLSGENSLRESQKLHPSVLATIMEVFVIMLEFLLIHEVDLFLFILC